MFSHARAAPGTWSGEPRCTEEFGCFGTKEQKLILKSVLIDLNTRVIDFRRKNIERFGDKYGNFPHWCDENWESYEIIRNFGGQVFRTSYSVLSGSTGEPCPSTWADEWGVLNQHEHIVYRPLNISKRDKLGVIVELIKREPCPLVLDVQTGSLCLFPCDGPMPDPEAPRKRRRMRA